MKNKNIISLFIALAFLCLATTGMLLYFGLKPEAVTAIHVLLGLLFVGFAVFHIKNNWSSLKVYGKERKGGKIKKEFLIAAVVVLLFLVGAGFSLPPFAQIQHFGEDLTHGKSKGDFFDKISFVKITTSKGKKGTSLHLMIEKSNEVITPIITMWIEDTAGNFVDNIFVPTKTIEVTSGEADKRHALFEGETEMKVFNQAMMLDWQSKTKDTLANYPDATPTDNFFLSTTTKATNKFQIFLEIKDGNTNELYKGSIDIAKGAVISLKSTSNKLLVSAIVEVK